MRPIHLIFCTVLLCVTAPALTDDTERLLLSLESMESGEVQGILAGVRALAERGDRTAQYWMGRYHHDLAPLHQRNFTEGRTWLESASVAGHVRATEMLARIHEVGFIVPADHDVAARYYRRLMDLGVASAGHDLARLELAKDPRDGAKILEYLEQAASRDHAQSVVDLAFLNAAGTVADVDGDAAYLWAWRGMELRQPRAMNLLARLYANGIGVDADVAEALKWAILARDAGDEESAALAREIAAAVPEEVQHEARARALQWREMNDL